MIRRYVLFSDLSPEFFNWQNFAVQLGPGPEGEEPELPEVKTSANIASATWDTAQQQKEYVLRECDFSPLWFRWEKGLLRVGGEFEEFGCSDVRPSSDPMHVHRFDKKDFAARGQLIVLSEDAAEWLKKKTTGLEK